MELLTCNLVSVFHLYIFDLRLFLLLVIIIKVFSSLVQTFEEVHHVPEPYINLKFINILENLSCFDFAIDVEGNFRSIEAKTFLICSNHLLGSLLLRKHVEKLFIINFSDAHYDERNEFSELNDALPKAQQNCLLE